MKILFSWTGVTSYMADCWRALQAVPGVELKVIVEAVESGKSFDATQTLHDLDCTLVDSASPLQHSIPGFRPDVVFAGGWRSPTTRCICASNRDVPKVFCLDMPWRRSVRCFLARFALRGFLRQFRAIYVPGASSARYARWLGFREGQIVCGLYAVDQKRLRAKVATGARRGFLFVGRYSPEKRRDLVEKAYARYRELGGTWTVDYYGQGGKFAQASEMPEVYATHACLLLASAFDPWPLVMLEARSAGLEVIASDRCGNVDELCAVKVGYGDVEAMARAMLSVERGGRRPAPENLGDYDCPAWVARTSALVERLRKDGTFEPNGMLVVDRLLREHGLIAADEVWVHGMWTIDKWFACIRAKLQGKKLVRMTHGSLSPMYLEQQSKWKKRLVKPIEMFLFALSDRVVTTGSWESEWVRRWGYKGKIEVVDLKQFFKLPTPKLSPSKPPPSKPPTPLHVLYLGRRHPLKGVEYLEQAVAEVNEVKGQRSEVKGQAADRQLVELRVVSDHFGEELEHDWDWCDVLCLPTLSENFGLVVAEALARGKRVITTDGAPAWVDEAGDRLIYLRGYREGSKSLRVQLLREALVNVNVALGQTA